MSIKRVLITGGTGSVGKALVREFCRANYIVSFTYNDNSDTARELSENYGALPVKIDFLQEIKFSDFTFDILINNAGINITSDLIHEIPREKWELTIRINLFAPIYLTQVCIPHMLRNKWGRIINISSIYGLRGVDYNAPYNISKHGLAGLTKSIAKEYGSEGITGNEICPGPVVSNMMNRIGEDDARSQGITRDEYFERLASNIPLKRLAYPEDISNLALFLSSDQASYINGISIPLDGGLIS